MVVEPTDERLPQLGGLLAHPTAGHVGQDLGVAFAGDQRGHHRPSGDPEDVRGHDRDLDLGVLQQLLDALLLRGPCADQVDPVPGQVAQHPDRLRRHEASPQHLSFGHLAQPYRVESIRLGSTRQVLDVLGVDQPRLEGALQQVERGLPVIAGGLHDHPAHAQAGQPVRHRQQRAGHRGEGAHLLQPSPARAGQPHAAHQFGLADVQRCDPLDDLLIVVLNFHHGHHLRRNHTHRRPPVGAAGKRRI